MLLGWCCRWGLRGDVFYATINGSHSYTKTMCFAVICIHSAKTLQSIHWVSCCTSGTTLGSRADVVHTDHGLDPYKQTWGVCEGGNQKIQNGKWSGSQRRREVLTTQGMGDVFLSEVTGVVWFKGICPSERREGPLGREWGSSIAQ